MVSFYTDFAAAYGTVWLITLGIAVLTMSHIDAGAFGLFGFPVIALIYAFLRRPSRKAAQQERDELRSQVGDLRDRLAQQRLEAQRHPRPMTDGDDAAAPPEFDPAKW